MINIKEAVTKTINNNPIQIQSFIMMIKHPLFLKFLLNKIILIYNKNLMWIINFIQKNYKN